MQFSAPIPREIDLLKGFSLSGKYHQKPMAPVDMAGAPIKNKIKDMAATGPVIADEMQVVSGNIDSLDIGRASEPDNRSRDVVHFKDALSLGRLHQRGIGPALSGDAARFHVRKGPGDLYP
jgi:hypothetical protein